MARATVATADNTTRVDHRGAVRRLGSTARERSHTDSTTQAPDAAPPSRSRGFQIPEPQQALQTLSSTRGTAATRLAYAERRPRGKTAHARRRPASARPDRARLGVRVILTRDDDRTVGIDERAAAANNGKADLLSACTPTAALSGSPSGAEVFYVRLDREGEAVKREAAAGAVSLPVLGGGTRTIDVIPWDLAQARHIDASAMLAIGARGGTAAAGADEPASHAAGRRCGCSQRRTCLRLSSRWPI